MKKTYVQIIDGTNGQVEGYAYGSGEERFALYTGIDQLHGGWLLETAGDPVTLAALEDAEDDCSEIIASVNRVLADSLTCWESLTAEDAEYVSDFLAECGIEA